LYGYAAGALRLLGHQHRIDSVNDAVVSSNIGCLERRRQRLKVAGSHRCVNDVLGLDSKSQAARSAGFAEPWNFEAVTVNRLCVGEQNVLSHFD
jgi:hypothetical protein